MEVLKSLAQFVALFSLALTIYLPVLHHLCGLATTMQPLFICLSAGVSLLALLAFFALGLILRSPQLHDQQASTTLFMNLDDRPRPVLHANIKYEIYLCLYVEEALGLKGVCREFFHFRSPAVQWNAENLKNPVNRMKVLIPLHSTLQSRKS